MHIKSTRVAVIAGLLLLLLVLPQLALADGPAIFDVSVTDITGTTAQISWNTNTTSDSRVNYGDTIGLGTPAYVGSNNRSPAMTATCILFMCTLDSRGRRPIEGVFLDEPM